MQLLPPSPSIDTGAFTHAVIVLTVVVAITVLVGLGKLDATSATPLYGAALGVAPLAANARRQPPPG